MCPQQGNLCHKTYSLNPTYLAEIWLTGSILPGAFEQYCQCLGSVYAAQSDILRPDQAHAGEFSVEAAPIPPEFFGFHRNIFSTLFQSVYRLLDIPLARCILYGQLNHLFRVWVTSADNLLDSEDKIVLPIQLPRNSRVMREVVAIMTADRIMNRILHDAVKGNSLSTDEAMILSEKSLHVLLPSAAEEASEEGGITHRPSPQYVLHTIHRLKTGLLFQIPFLGPDSIETEIDPTLLADCKDAMNKFGLGCQILDDIRDMAKDHIERRHNYILSTICHEKRISYSNLLESMMPQMQISSKIHSYFPDVIVPAAALAHKFLQEGLDILCQCGLDINESAVSQMADSMYYVLDVGDALP
jgi:hypothetical protein